MKTIGRLFVLAAFGASIAFGQASGPIIQFVNTDPTGACANPTPFQYNQQTGNMSGCNSSSGQWASIAGGAGPQGPPGSLGTTTRSATATHTLSETDRYNNWTFTGTAAPTLTLYTPADGNYWAKACNGTTVDGTVAPAGNPYGTGATGSTSTANFTFPHSTFGLISCMIFSWSGSVWSIDPTSGPGVSSPAVAVTTTKTLAQGDSAILQQISGTTFTVNAPPTPANLSKDWAVPMTPTGTVDYTLSGNGNTINGQASVTLKGCPASAPNGCYGYVLQLDAAGTNYILRGGIVGGGGGTGCTTSGSAGQVLSDSGAGGCTSNSTAAGILTLFGTPSSANLAAALTDETGTGLAVFGTSPTIVTPTIASMINANHTHAAGAGGGVLALGTAIPNLSGDITTSGSSAATLPTVNSNVGTCGDSTHTSQVTLNAKGLTTACTAVSITAGTGNSASNVTTTFSATPTFTCGSATAGTTTLFSLSTAMTSSISSSTLATCTPGQTIAWHLVQDGTGGRTFAPPTNFDAVTIDGTPSTATDVFYAYDGTNGRLLSVNGKATPFLLGQAPERAAPTTATSCGSGLGCLWFDSTNHIPSAKDNNSGTVSNMIVPSTCSNQFISAVGVAGTITCSTVTLTGAQFANQGTTTTLLHGNGSGNPSFTSVVTNDLAANAVTSAKLAVVNTYRYCDIPVGDTSGSVLVDAQLGPQKHVCKVPAAATVVEVDVDADAGSPSVIVGRGRCTTFSAGTCSAETIVNLTSSALAVSSGFEKCSNTGGTTGLDAGTTCSATLQNTGINAGDWIQLVSGTAGGTAKFFVAHVVYTIN